MYYDEMCLTPYCPFEQNQYHSADGYTLATQIETGVAILVKHIFWISEIH